MLFTTEVRQHVGACLPAQVRNPRATVQVIDAEQPSLGLSCPVSGGCLGGVCGQFGPRSSGFNADMTRTQHISHNAKPPSLQGYFAVRPLINNQVHADSSVAKRLSNKKERWSCVYYRGVHVDLLYSPKHETYCIY